VPGEGEYPSFSSLNDLIDHYRDEGLACTTGVQIKLLKVTWLTAQPPIGIIRILFVYLSARLSFYSVQTFNSKIILTCRRTKIGVYVVSQDRNNLVANFDVKRLNFE